jgi:butyryl-CoA dehydrogenase
VTAAFSLAAWRRFCREVVQPAAPQADRSALISEEIWSGVGEHGYLQLFHAAPLQAEVLWPAMMALAEACAATFWKATISSALCGRMIAAFASAELQQRWLGELAAGGCVGAFAATERGSGSDPASYAARLLQRGAGWVLRGEKDRISNACDAAVAAVLCPAFDEREQPLGLALAVVELRGATVTRTRRETLGLRAMELGRLVFDDTPLSAEAVTLDTTMEEVLSVVEWGHVIHSVSGLGVGRRALLEAERFLCERPSFGRPLVEHPVVRAQVEEARAELAAGAALARRAVRAKARGEVAMMEAGVGVGVGVGVEHPAVGPAAEEAIVAAKIFCSEAGLAACQTAMRVCGGWGFTTELEVERLLRDAHGNAPAGLPNDRLRELLIAPRLGFDAWKRREGSDAP